MATPKAMLAIFLATLLMPFFFHVGDLRLSPYRILLLILFIPFLLRVLSGAAGRIAPGDIFIGLHCIWIGIALFMNHGAERIPFIGITVVELFGGYLAGRVLIRSADAYRTLFRYFLFALFALLPFVVFEMLTARMLISEILRPVVSTFPKVLLTDMRMGLHRAQAVFEHSILWGVFCSVAIANLFYIYRSNITKSLGLPLFATGMTFTSLSSGPLLSVGFQFGMIIWGWLTRNAWWPLVGLTVVCYIVVDALSNRTPVTILIDYVTFNAHNAWIRIHIWNFGTAEVWSNPLFGIGLGDWRRPHWLGSSVDNFWLVVAMRYGIPGFLLLVIGVVLNFILIFRSKLQDDLKAYRLAYVIAALGLFISLSTVHVWGATSVFFMFYIGAGSWLFSRGLQAGEPDEEAVTMMRPRREAGERPRVSVPAPLESRGGRKRRDRADVLARRRAAYERRRS